MLNKIETEFREILRRENQNGWLVEQSITFKLANGVRYTPDFVTYSAFTGEFNGYEVKGFMRDDAGVKLKMAAKEYPWFRWILVWKQKGNWKRQVILP